MADPVDLVKIFETLEKNLTKSEKHFKKFSLENRFVTELEGNTFKDITFDEIDIYACYQLTKIHKNAFAGTDLFIKSFLFSRNEKFSDNSIFEVISKFVNLEVLQLTKNNITEIPSNAFHKMACYQDKLRDLTIGGTSIREIGSRPFSQLRGLKYLTISDTSIDYIPEYAFEFDEESNQILRLDIDLFLNSSSLHQNSLMHFKRPVYLYLGYHENHYEYLDENIFRSFLTSNSQNQIEMGSMNFDCDNYRNLWLRRQSNLLERFIGIECSNIEEVIIAPIASSGGNRGTASEIGGNGGNGGTARKTGGTGGNGGNCNFSSNINEFPDTGNFAVIVSLEIIRILLFSQFFANLVHRGLRVNRF